MKLFRRLEAGISPDLEVGRFLTERGFPNIPPLAGALEYEIERPRGVGMTQPAEPVTLAILQRFVPNQGDAWRYTLAALDGYLERVAAHAQPEQGAQSTLRPPAGRHLLDRASEQAPPEVHEAIGPYLVSAQMLGRRSAELHAALSSDPTQPGFAPEPFTLEYQQSLYRSIRNLATQCVELIANKLARERQGVPSTLIEARRLFESDGGEALLAPVGFLLNAPVDAVRTRCHGDYHLGQVLYTGSDFVIIDFEGEPARPLGERRMKHSPLKDVAGMLRSFHYAAYAALFNHTPGGTPDERRRWLEGWVGLWYDWVAASYLQEYLLVARDYTFLPADRHTLGLLLDSYLLEKAIYELVYELNNRPDWIQIPLQGILQLVRPEGTQLG